MTAPGVSRRSVLAGGAALALVTACGGGDDGDSDDEASPDPTTGTEDTGTLLVLLPQQGILTTDGEQRVPVVVTDAEGVPLREGLEPREFQVRPETGEATVVLVEPHDDGVPTPYYPVTFAAGAAGLHELTAVGEDGLNALTFDIGESTAIPAPGRPLPPFETPTVDDPRGVDPICTRTPPCTLHERTLAEALQAGGPVALLIATPEFCQTAICGPVLDLFVDALADFPSVTGIHAEVYADPRGADDPTAGGLAPITEAYALPFEPTLYLVGADGTIVRRLDSVYDRVELRDALGEIA